MKKRKIIWLAVLLSFLGISNYCGPLINFLIEGVGQQYHFQSESGDFHFVLYPIKGRDLGMMKRQYESYVKNEGKEREEIYRTFRMNPLKFWNWYQYATDDLYRYKYKKYKSRNGT
ncbi:MAG: hypothetical protein AAGG75_07950 [Bacteroidota bacterium]